jgi:uncharacterized protein YjbI with pentapeptide repeats/uncharacterized protein YecT (DUF1311 family)
MKETFTRLFFSALCLVLLTGGIADAPENTPKTYWSLMPYPDGEACTGKTTALPSVQPRAVFAGKYIKGMNWQKANLQEADFRNAILVDVDLSDARLAKARFDGARLCHVTLTGADLSGTSFKATRLEHSELKDIKTGSADWTNATLLATSIAGADFHKAQLVKTIMVCAGFTMDTMCEPAEKINFSQADLTGATLLNLGQGLNFTGAKAEGAIMDQAYISALSPASFTKLKLAPGLFSHRDPASFTREEILRLAKDGQNMKEIISVNPSFDCARAGTAVEKYICESSDLAALDAIVGRLYQKGAAGTAPQDKLRAAQRDWLTKRNKCTANDPSCLKRAYNERIAALLPLVAKKGLENIKPGYYAPADESRFLPLSAVGTPLAARLLALNDNATDYVKIAWEDEDTVSVEAFTLGGNAHMCSLDGYLKGDPIAGGYRYLSEENAPAEEDGPLLTPLGDLLLMRGGRDFCGMRAGWHEVWRRSRQNQ